MWNVLWPLVVAVVPLVGVGCIGIPLEEHPQTESHQEVRSLVGDAHSGRPIRVGATTRREALVLLGNPLFHADEPPALGYEYRVHATKWYGPLVVNSKAIWPLTPRYTPASYFLFLAFDSSDVLRRFDLQRRYGYEERGQDGMHSRRKRWAAFLNAVPTT